LGNFNFDGRECYSLIDTIFKECGSQKRSFRAEDFGKILGTGKSVEMCQIVLDQMMNEGKLECGPDPAGIIEGTLYASREAYIEDGS